MCRLLPLLLLAACSSERGEALFAGRTPLTGTIVGHDQPLPLEASRCANCHLPGIVAPLASVDAGETFGTPLTSATLREARPRRGGPATKYELASFCRLLREGIDPGDIVILRAMPRYTLSDEDCAALWKYVTAK